MLSVMQGLIGHSLCFYMWFVQRHLQKHVKPFSAILVWADNWTTSWNGTIEEPFWSILRFSPFVHLEGLTATKQTSVSVLSFLPKFRSVERYRLNTLPRLICYNVCWRANRSPCLEQPKIQQLYTASQMGLYPNRKRLILKEARNVWNIWLNDFKVWKMMQKEGSSVCLTSIGLCYKTKNTRILHWQSYLSVHNRK
jgi:hypothetical protein